LWISDTISIIRTGKIFRIVLPFERIKSLLVACLKGSSDHQPLKNHHAKHEKKLFDHQNFNYPDQIQCCPVTAVSLLLGFFIITARLKGKE